MQSGLVEFEKPRINSRRGRSLLAAGIAAESHRNQTEIRKLEYERSQLALQLSRSSGRVQQEELAAFYAYFNLLAGTDLDPEKVMAERVQRRIDRYEQLTGYKLDSQEFAAAVDATIAAMNA